MTAAQRSCPCLSPCRHPQDAKNRPKQASFGRFVCIVPFALFCDNSGQLSRQAQQMKKIALSGVRGAGRYALVDDNDYPRLVTKKWHLTRAGYVTNSGKMYLHRSILAPGPGSIIDHRNHDPLDNRRSNLRICTRSQNGSNRRRTAPRVSPYKGVSFHKPTGRWHARITLNGRLRSLRFHDTPEEAALAYNAAALKLFGEFAYLNDTEQA